MRDLIDVGLKDMSIVELQELVLDGDNKAEEELSLRLFMLDMGINRRRGDFELEVAMNELRKIFPDKKLLLRAIIKLLKKEYDKTCNDVKEKEIEHTIELMASSFVSVERKLMFYKIKKGSVEDAEKLDSLIKEDKVLRPDSISLK